MRWLIVLLCAVPLVGCGKPPVHFQESFVFGTRVELLVAESDAAKAKAAGAAVLREFDRLHRAYHAWQPSDLTMLNEAIAAGRESTVSPELASLIADAQAMSVAGEHLFDPGIGGLVRLWGFQSDTFRPELPEQNGLSAWRRAAPSIADLHLADGRVASNKREVALDFGGYLKGVALDRASAILREAGIGNALINIGGNVMALGSKYSEPWRVGIQHPRQPGAIATLELFDGEAIGTSGDYQRFFEIDGQRFCHLLDPRTASPAAHTRSLTVLVHPQPKAGMRSDVLSKPLFIAGRADWQRLAGKLGVAEALRVDADGSVQVTHAFALRLKFEPGVPAPGIIE